MADDRAIGEVPTQAGAAPSADAGGRPGDPCAMVIFGAFGDLTSRLVVPALYNLERTGRLPEAFALIGVDHRDSTADAWRSHLQDTLKGFVGDAASEFHPDKLDEDAWKRLADKMSYLSGDITGPDVYKQLGEALDEAARTRNTGGAVLFYLAVADHLFGPAVDALGEAGLTREPADAQGKPKAWRRVVIEKPFGHDLASARALNERVLRTLKEEQIFRIDHFLGKDTVQGIMAFRFANGLFEPIWNRDRIDHVQITVSETVGVEARGRFYEATGALRDMVPNHLLTLLAMVAMEPPSGFAADAIRDRKAELFAAMRPADPANAVRGQYGPGQMSGKSVSGYRQEPDVAADSKVETYAALTFEIDNWRWAGVPFFIRTGKHMTGRLTEIAIRFKQAPYAVFHDTPVASLKPNWLVIGVAPDEGISLQFEVKKPGAEIVLSPVRMAFRYDDWFPRNPAVGYETLIGDAMRGDQTLFTRADMAEEAWRVVQPVLDAWAREAPDFPNYASGSAGPAAADDLLARCGGRAWRPIETSMGTPVP